MATGANFDSTKRPMQELLREIDQGKLQLPDFQRGWVWDDDRIRSLIASLSVSFPIGAVMLLETGGEGVRFKPRAVQGAKGGGRDPETLILDGQQRLTSLFQAIWSGAVVKTVDSRKKKIERFYYFDMGRAVRDEDREEAIVSVPGDRIVKAFGGDIVLDVTTRENEFEEGLFPANQIFSSAEWRQDFQEYWDFSREKSALFNDFEREVIKRFEQYSVPVIELKKETPKEAVCLVFEKVNTGGVALNVFELLTASFAADDFQLRDDWDERRKRMRGESPVLKSVKSDDFLQAITLMVTLSRRRQAMEDGTPADRAPGVSCKRREILKLVHTDYLEWADEIEQGFAKAARFLTKQHIFRSRDVPYRTQLVPLAAIFTELGSLAEPDGAQRKISRWYWSGVLGELYGGATESRFAKDLPEVSDFVRKEEGPEPSTISEANFQAERLLTLRTRNSAAYKGVYALLMRDGGLDFLTGEGIQFQTFFDDNIDIHHIFPRKWCDDQGISSKVYNSIVNKTPLAARTNRKIGKKAPSDYLPSLQSSGEISDERMEDILRSHRIDPDAMWQDDFTAFFDRRGRELLQVIESAIGRPVSADGWDQETRDALPDEFLNGDQDDEESDEWE